MTPSFPDAQVKLSYLLGHREEIARAAAEAGIDFKQLLAAAFLSGIHTRGARGLEAYCRFCAQEGKRPMRILPHDPFAGRPFGTALAEVAEPLKG